MNDPVAMVLLTLTLALVIAAFSQNTGGQA